MPARIFLLLFLSLIFSSTTFAMAKDGCGGDCMSCHSMSVKEAEELFRGIGAKVRSVKPSPAKGLFEVLLEKEGKPGVLFVDYSKKHIIQGVMVEYPGLKPVASHQSEFESAPQTSSLDPSTIPVKYAVTIANPKGSRKLFVFTDPDCPYCRNFHAELHKLGAIAPDVSINIMLFPLPMHPDAYDKSRAILESNSVKLLDAVFEGKEAPKPKKESSRNAINEIIKFGNASGISGTPTIVLPDGRIVVGGRDAVALKKMLE